MNSEKAKIESLLERVGLGFLPPACFSEQNIVLRDGRTAELWVDQVTGHGILDPKFWEDQGFYQEEYRKEFSSVLGGACTQERHAEVYRGLNGKQFRQFSEHFKSGDRYLEIGCSFGGILNRVLKTGAEEVWGIEPNVSDCAYLEQKYPRAKVLNAGFEESGLPDSYFDMVTSFEVLEHVPNPSLFVAKLARILKIGGRVNIEVPNHRDALLSQYKNKAYEKFFYHKAHIHYFTAESLQALFSHHGLVGLVRGFQMYPFTNQVHWLLNNGPQPSAVEALNWPQNDGPKRPLRDKLDDFITHACRLYDDTVENSLISDCLIFQGLKAPF